VSSDGVSIASGSNFLSKIEKGLTNCCAAIYLISPSSVKRSWINFELGAIWIRNILQLNSGGAEIPLIPVCHSGSTPSGLPSPINNLNGIIGNEAAQLELAFQSLQATVGGRGKLKTDFVELANKINSFSKAYTTGSRIRQLLSQICPPQSLPELVANGRSLVAAGHSAGVIRIENLHDKNAKAARALISDGLSEHGFKLKVLESTMAASEDGIQMLETVELQFPWSVVFEHSETILKQP
jgi:hypothetical protein